MGVIETTLLTRSIVAPMRIGAWNRIALEAVVFRETPEANAYRCELLADWAESYRDKNWDFRPDQLRGALTNFVNYAHQAPAFCVED